MQRGLIQRIQWTSSPYRLDFFYRIRWACPYVIFIEEAIREAGLKKKYVANKLGVSDTYINEYLKKPGSISVKNASIICKLINVNYIYV